MVELKQARERIVAKWNKDYPPGSTVVVALSDGNVIETKTAEAARMWDGRPWVRLSCGTVEDAPLASMVPTQDLGAMAAASLLKVKMADDRVRTRSGAPSYAEGVALCEIEAEESRVAPPTPPPEEIRVWTDYVEARRSDGRVVRLNGAWGTRLVRLLGRHPQTFEEVERALDVFMEFYLEAVDRIEGECRELPAGSPERVAVERAFFGTNGLPSLGKRTTVGTVEAFEVGAMVMFGDGCRGPGEPCLVLSREHLALSGVTMYTIRRPGNGGDTYADGGELRAATLPDVAEWLRGGA
jgi:hypothetical protein